MEFIGSVWFFAMIAIFAIWEMAWKLIALWRSARKNHIAWFVCIGIFNTIGILPIVYLIINRKKSLD